MIKHIRVYNLYKFAVFLLFLQSMFFWPLYRSIPSLIFMTFIILVIVLNYIYNGKRLNILTKRYLLSIIIYFLLLIYTSLSGNIYSTISVIPSTLIIAYIITLKKTYKIDLLVYITNGMGFILSLSIIYWILFLIGVNLPSFNLIDTGYPHQNYLLFLYIPQPYPIPRFSSYFLEPGHLGMIASLLLFANNFNFKKRANIVILISLILTFSLAAYVLFLVSLFSRYLLEKRKFKLLKLSGYILLFFLSVNFFSMYKSGDNTINNLLINRIDTNDYMDLVDKNRFSVGLTDYYSKFMQTNDKFIGIGLSKYSETDFGPGGSSGYKVFIIQYGIVGAILLIIFYLSMLPKNISKISIAFLIVFILAFLQRNYALWMSEIIIFITGNAILNTDEKYKLKEKDCEN